MGKIAWELQKELQKNPIPNQQRLKEMIYDCKDPIAKILFTVAYLTGARINEVLDIRKKDISISWALGKKVLLFDMLNEKNKKRPRKYLPIPFEKEEWFINIILPYIEVLLPDNKLFNFNKHRAYQILKKYFGMGCHYVRHIRLTHLVILYNFNDRFLTMWAGWADSRPAKVYVELRWSDLVKAM